MSKSDFKTIYRFTGKDAPPLPLSVRSVGHYQIFSSWQDTPYKKNFVQLFWGISGEGIFVIDNHEYKLKPNHVTIYFSGDKHIISCKKDWEYRWLTIDGAMPDKITNAFGLSRKPRLTGACPEAWFEKLESEVQDFTPQGQQAASVTAYAILAAASRPAVKSIKSDRRIESCLSLIREKYPDPTLDTSWLAEKLKVHRTNLSKMFKKKMHMSLANYILSLRLQKAMHLLSKTDLSVAEIAKRTGFAYSNYFSSVIKKSTGKSPGAYRKKQI